MLRFGALVVLAISVLSGPTVVAGPASAAPVPRVVKFAGAVPGAAAGTLSVRFAIYGDPTTSEPLWAETQSVSTDEAGRFTVLLGASLPDGLPIDLFASGDGRWLGIQPDGRPEQSRVLLVSVPYALKAVDAETIGGKPLSAFVLAGDTTGPGADGLTYVNAQLLANSLATGGAASSQGGSGAANATASALAGTANYVALFTDATNLGNSALYQTGAGRVGINTTAPSAPFHVMANETPGAFFDVYSGAGVLGALPVVFRAGRGTAAAPAAVQSDDILGGLAVRGYNGTTFTGGRGQVMFKAAENWSTTANGTYLTMATVPAGASAPASERLRITADGKVGIGTTAPGQALSVAGTIESTAGGFKFPDGTTQSTRGLSGVTGGAGISVTGGAPSPTVAVASGGIVNAMLATLAVADANISGVSAGKISGSLPVAQVSGAATVLANTFAGTQTITGGNLALPATASVSAGVLTLGGQAFLHAFGDATNTFVGGAAGGGFLTTGLSNAGVGNQALTANTTGNDNNAFGAQSLKANTTGSWNNAVGYQSLAGNTSGTSNNAFGFQASAGNTTATYNSAFGHMTLRATTNGGANSAFGSGSLGANTTGYSNTAIGASAGSGNLTGFNNAFVGSNAGSSNTAGGNNTFLGAGSGPDAAHGALSYATAVGAGAQVTASNALVLGGTNGTASAVSVGIGTTAPLKTLQVVGDIRIGTSGTNGCLENFAGTALSGTCSSDLRLKTSIRPFDSVLGKVAQLQPVHFEWRVGEFPNRHFGTATNAGLIAQDVEQVFPELVSTDAQGYKQVNYSELPYLTLAAVRELKAENDALKAQLTSQKDALTAQLAALAERLAAIEKQR